MIERSGWKLLAFSVCPGRCSRLTDKPDNFSHYAYPTIALDACSFAFLLLASSAPSHRVYHAFIILSHFPPSLPPLSDVPTLLFLFSRSYTPSRTSFSYGTLPDVQTTPFLALRTLRISLRTLSPLVLTSYPPTSDFLSPCYHTVFISVGPLYEIRPRAQNCAR